MPSHLLERLNLKNEPKCVVLFNEPVSETTHSAYIKEILRQHLFKELFEEGSFIFSKFKEQIPKVVKSDLKTIPGEFSFFSVSRSRVNVFKFFYEMTGRYLSEGAPLNVIMIYAVDFMLPEFSNEVFTLSEVMCKVDEKSVEKLIERRFPLIQREILLGLASPYFAKKILELKGLSTEDKSGIIHAQTIRLIQKMPLHFNQDLITEMQHFLLICQEPFKQLRSCKSLIRIVCHHFLFRIQLLKSLEERYVCVKVIRLRVATCPVVGVIVGLNFLRDKEVFEQKQLLRAIQQLFPDIKYVEGSFVLNRRGSEPISTLYLEIEKEPNFTTKELVLLQKELTKEIKNHIECLVQPVFMPRNEEEIMRNIMSLSNQLQFVRDLPQVFISFDQQSRTSLFFTLILVRLLRGDSKPIHEYFLEGQSFLNYIHDRVKTVGYLRKKHPKEATVFRVKFLKDDFLRGDQSIDLYKARQAVVFELKRLIGDFRDFNGGMISKQSELFSVLKTSLEEDKVRFNPLTLENFFYALNPVIMQTVLSIEVLKKFFKMFLETLQTGPSYELKVQEDEMCVYLIFLSNDLSLNEKLNLSLNTFQHQSAEVATFELFVNDIACSGFLFRSTHPLRRVEFVHKIESALAIPQPQLPLYLESNAQSDFLPTKSR